ncbi:hypothetical protein [Halarsenatibacter silvermanii]|uniref:Uncharacterized protein n=1 Tax=Halarsenatibacter silvermanii TaxID=321763 RepID=A0A1G9M1I9_9FIRM|nr:hypothetical protein [Halarsenatibacter silvermanii]SDL68129.1 hypothetical protein SAMN04488692_10778 [Halarsenatibacter silvermanii]
MEILLNGKKQDLGMYDKIDDMRELIKFIHTFIGEDIVKTVEIDEEEYTAEEIEAGLNLDMDAVSRVNLKTTDDKKKARENIKANVIEELPEMRDNFQQAAAEFALGDEEKGYEMVHDTLKNLEWIVLKIEVSLKRNDDEDGLEEINSIKEGFDGILKELDSEINTDRKGALTEMAEKASNLVKRLEELVEISDTTDTTS